MICVFIALFLESEAQELGSIGVSVIVITYYENQQQMLPSYMTRLILLWYVCNLLIKRYCNKPTMCQKSLVQQI